MRWEDPMTGTETGSGSVDRMIESFRDTGNNALESVRKFLDTVNGAFPDVGADNGPRQRIIDSAFKMTEQLVGASTQLAEKIVEASQGALGSGAGVPRRRRAAVKGATKASKAGAGVTKASKAGATKASKASAGVTKASKAGAGVTKASKAGAGVTKASKAGATKASKAGATKASKAGATKASKASA
jgi:hypothetical protein